MIEFLLTQLPIESFDQQKLESLLRNIPSAFVREVRTETLTKKFYSYPTKPQDFKIECTGDHVLNARLPSASDCSFVILKNFDARYDEVIFDLQDSQTVRELNKAISYSLGNKKYFSHERVYGLGLDGRYNQLFRYAFTCTPTACKLSVATGSADLF